MKTAGRIARGRQARDEARDRGDIARAPYALARELTRSRLEPMIERGARSHDRRLTIEFVVPGRKTAPRRDRHAVGWRGLVGRDE
ncbi:hypothetical protein [Sphingomonas sp. 10B4]|uniref:hypothetical protein n=1 Tax=Sphingomonas sp. 10B4 TaxID=3048575 RepID=UPI002AB43690|nr:hypothetical protein [Sphingomonas sp. 10B4]MDY7526185.1 hypothetical protein [Sphingomonas sp. 10B4]MEB0284289.1 hypothetical protein [Sphingomonas sp. 10B4]